eukprot:1143068-Pelagomonas_calceolata.AAC.1
MSNNPLCHHPGCYQFNSALHMLSGCQNHSISSMKTERHNVAGRMIIKALSKSPWGAGLVNMDIGCGDRLAQHNLQIPAHASNSIVSPYLFPRNFVTDLDSPPAVLYNAILITPYKAKPTSASPSTSCLYHHALRSRRNPTLRATTANHVRQPHQLN